MAGKHLNARVYEYVDEDGNTYWSFHRSDNTVTQPKRLFLRKRIGLHLINFLTYLRALGQTEESEG